MMRAWVAALLLGACAPALTPERPPPRAPALARLEPSVPPDLDLVLRVDLERIRQTLGAASFGELAERRRLAPPASDAGTQRLLDAAFARARSVLVGLRPGRSWEASDVVVVLTGDFSGLDLRPRDATPPWGPPADLGADVRRLDRRLQPRQHPRNTPARLYLLGTRTLIFISEAELDAAERLYEIGTSDRPLEPPARGALSAVARGRLLADGAERRFPRLAGLLSETVRMEAHADVGARGLEAALELELGDAQAAEALRGPLETLQGSATAADGALAKFVAAASVDLIGNTWTARWDVPLARLGPLALCLFDDVGC